MVRNTQISINYWDSQPTWGSFWDLIVCRHNCSLYHYELPRTLHWRPPLYEEAVLCSSGLRRLKRCCLPSMRQLLQMGTSQGHWGAWLLQKNHESYRRAPARNVALRMHMPVIIFFGELCQEPGQEKTLRCRSWPQDCQNRTQAWHQQNHHHVTPTSLTLNLWNTPCLIALVFNWALYDKGSGALN